MSVETLPFSYLSENQLKTKGPRFRKGLRWFHFFKVNPSRLF
jgi:hypothetical protein